MSTRAFIAGNVAVAMLGGAWTERALRARVEAYLGARTRRSQRRFIANLFGKWPRPYPPAPDWIVDFLTHSAMFDLATARLCKSMDKGEEPRRVVMTAPAFAPAPPFADLPVPKLATLGDLAAWLEISAGDLEWFADFSRRNADSPPILRHYVYSFIPKRSGAARLIESPKPRLKAMQRRILHDILDHAPAHPSAHGFVRGRSCISAAQRHAGEAVVIAADLKDFFASVSAARVHGLFRRLGYPHAAARALTGLCCAATPACVFRMPPADRRFDWAAQQMFRTPHLPQGAPTSPALANLCAWALDQRLAGLAARFGGAYSRYADDLYFSGDEAFARKSSAFLRAVEEIVRDERFRLNPAKTRIMRASARQHVTGIVVNRHVNAPRRDYEALKAILHNCARSGPASQNREGLSDFRAHLEGRIGWIESLNRARGARLRDVFETIAW
jgi:hypothetical protein